MDWFCYHVETIDNLKIKSLSDRLFRFWIDALCLSREHGGELPSIKVCSFRLRITHQRAARQIEELISARLLDRDGETVKPHDWNDWQPKSDSGAARRMRNFRQRNSVTATSPLRNEQRNVTRIELDRDIENIKAEPPRAKPARCIGDFSIEYTQWFDEEFWPNFWRRTDKASGKKALYKHAQSEDDRKMLLAAMLAQKPEYLRRDSQFRPHLSTWSNKERFRDDPEQFETGIDEEWRDPYTKVN